MHYIDVVKQIKHSISPQNLFYNIFICLKFQNLKNFYLIFIEFGVGIRPHFNNTKKKSNRIWKWKKSFALIGAAGFVAPRHMKAIKDTGNTLVAALDTNDSVGIIDSYFPEAKFFTQFEIFDRHVSKLSLNKTEKIDYFSICSPNYLHDSHIRYALRSGASAICEKPLVLEPHNLQQLKTFEQTSGKKISTILQLRLHPSVLKLRQDVKLPI